ncbi:type II toxin-antitoxin system VapB family antitoxin [Sphingomonas sp. MA1305]|uniref:type II toxin-antitoxin system VapB family antitoxin n=1 Tax=Sphingomonas sp. MA1305 TaxID=2479204 RepID=UPI0018E004AB|nr:type II toxin-antitoxin system VapB family antitoxin [Sphingomonas sp. MA1305]MBI0474190.1 type II toxin-antitoxin system VapB family antitoxin [Sphingomonas sp. MA1305]
MRTNIDIDEALLSKVMKALDIDSESDAVNEALRRLIVVRQQEAIRGLRGLGWDGDLDDMRTSKHLPAEW